MRLGQLDNNYSNINDIFISHMHFDHIVGLADFWLTSSLWQKKQIQIFMGQNTLKIFANN